MRKAIGWWLRQGWISADPTLGIERRPSPPDKTKALSFAQVAAVGRLDTDLRDKTLWRLLHESAARAEEAVCLNVEDLVTADKRGKITAKGGATEWIHRQPGTAQLLPRLIADRTRGPPFLTERRAPGSTPNLGVCPATGRARLSYRRAEEIFEETTQRLANPLARPEQWAAVHGFTLRRWWHSALTHDAESETRGHGPTTPRIPNRLRFGASQNSHHFVQRRLPGMPIRYGPAGSIIVQRLACDVARNDYNALLAGGTLGWCAWVWPCGSGCRPGTVSACRKPRPDSDGPGFPYDASGSVSTRP
ncbi:hypothetical protein AB0915_37050, partial [Streptomyces sp. NPDC048411]